MDEAIQDPEAIPRWLTQPGSGPMARWRSRTIRAAINPPREHPCLVGQRAGVGEQPRGGCRLLYEIPPGARRDGNALAFGPGQIRGRL
jgi:hypothetical protein